MCALIALWYFLIEWWFWHSLVTTRTPGESCSEFWSVECHAHEPHKLIHNPQVIWILFSCFDSRDNCDILDLVLHPLVIHKHNKTSIFQILFCMFPWVWECTSSFDAGGFNIIRECCDIIIMMLVLQNQLPPVMWFVSLWQNCLELDWSKFSEWVRVKKNFYLYVLFKVDFHLQKHPCYRHHWSFSVA